MLNFFVRHSRSASPHYHRGQGLLEAMLAIGMILLGLGAILTLTLQNISASAASGQQLAGAQLAREAIEAARQLRDSNWLAAGNSDPARTWDQGLTDSACLIAPCNGAWVGFDVTTSPTQFDINFVDTRNVDDTLVQLAVYRNRLTPYEWAQFSVAPDPSAYLTTGYQRLVVVDPVCSDGTTTSVRVGWPDCLSGTTKIGLRVEAAVSWPAAGVFGSGQRRQLRQVEYLYNWR